MNLLFFLKSRLHVSKQTVIHGSVTTDANSYIAGTINGDITTPATLFIEKSGQINGNAFAKNVIVKGRINGNIQSDGKVDVKKNGEINGHVYANEVNIHKDSLLKGNVRKLQAAGNDQSGYDENSLMPESINPSIADTSVKDEDKPESWF